MNLILSPSAIRDLQEISDYTLQTWGAEQEDRYLKGLWGKLAEIQSNPESCRLREDLGRPQKQILPFCLQKLKIMNDLIRRSIRQICRRPNDFNRAGLEVVGCC